MVKQEIWGYFLTHYAVTALICAAAANAGIDPDRVKLEQANASSAGPMTRLFPPDQRQRLLGRVMAGIADPRKLNEKRERSYPRVVKRARHNSYRQEAPSTATPRCPRDHQTRQLCPNQTPTAT